SRNRPRDFFICGRARCRTSPTGSLGKRPSGRAVSCSRALPDVSGTLLGPGESERCESAYAPYSPFLALSAGCVTGILGAVDEEASAVELGLGAIAGSRGRAHPLQP